MMKALPRAVLSPLLVLALLLSPALAQGEPGAVFSDVPQDAWYAQAALLCAREGLLLGTGADTFSPGAALTGPESAALAARLHSVLHGGDGTFEKAPEDWGKITLTLADGTELTAYGRNAAPLPETADGSFAFDWWTWGSAGHTTADNFQVVLTPGLSAAPDDPAYLAANEALSSWGKAREGAASVRVNGETIPGTVRCWLPAGNWVLAFYPDNGEDSAQGETLRAAVNSGAPAADAWWRDAAYYCARQGLELDFRSPDEPVTRAMFAGDLARAVGELPALGAIRSIPGADRETEPQVYMLYEAGILAGTDALGTFNPHGTLTRAEAAAMAARVLDEDLRLTPSGALLAQNYTLTPIGPMEGFALFNDVLCAYYNGPAAGDTEWYYYGYDAAPRDDVRRPGGADHLSFTGSSFICLYRNPQAPSPQFAASTQDWDPEAVPLYFYALADLGGNLIVPQGVYDEIVDCKDGTLAAAQGDTWYRLDPDGTQGGRLPDLAELPGGPLTPAGPYSSARSGWDALREGLLPVRDSGGSLGYLDVEGNPAIPLRDWCEITPFDGGYARVARSETGGTPYRWGVIDWEGREVFPCEYSDVTYMGQDIFRLETQDHAVLYRTAGGQDLESPHLAHIQAAGGDRFQHGYAVAGVQGARYIVDSRLRQVTETFDWCFPVSGDGRAFVGRWGWAYILEFGPSQG